MSSARRARSLPGHTGSGYLELAAARADGSVSWSVDVPEAGTALLEIRYKVAAGRHEGALEVNGGEPSPFVLWASGEDPQWVWDRQLAELRRGENTIRLTPRCDALVDHLNVLTGGPGAGF